MTASGVGDLIERAASGDQAAWNSLVDSYQRLVWSVIRGFRLDDATSADVFQTVWLRFVEHIERIRTPEAVASWLATTARHEAIRVSKARRRQVPTEFEYDIPDTNTPSPGELAESAEDERAAVEAFGRLGEHCQELLRLLIADPPLDYETISEITGRPIGSIGPTRGRCLDRLRRLMEAR